MENLDRLQLDKGKPLAGQIVFAIVETIRSGDTAVGTRLPSIRALADRLGVNRNTVAQAYKELAEKGYLSARHGGGSFAENPGQTFAQRAAGSVVKATVPQSTVPESGAPFSEGDWEFRYARRVSVFLSGRSPFSSRDESSAINLFQLRPNTDLFPLERFRRCLNTVLRRSGRLLLNYGAPTGYLPLREQIAVRLNAQGIRAGPGQILITSGSQQAIDLLARAFLDPGDSVVVESPTYAIALKIFTATGARLVPYPIGREGISFAPLNAFQLQPAPKLFYAVPNFQNPTTHSYSVEDKRSLLRQVYRAGSLLIEDAYYAELHEEPRRALAAMDTSGRVIYLKSTPEELMRRLRHDTQRPLLQVQDPLQRLRDLYAQRDPLYRETAHFVIDTGRPSVSTLVNMIVMQLELAGALPKA
ncbi:MAG: PLP-dependent aminotransferase family protein [SAR324 cluster bacterium]|nr:PLP-dependent aminotransferase family protein [SAR324 cluster bacterium]